MQRTVLMVQIHAMLHSAHRYAHAVLIRQLLSHVKMVRYVKMLPDSHLVHVLIMPPAHQMQIIVIVQHFHQPACAVATDPAMSLVKWVASV